MVSKKDELLDLCSRRPDLIYRDLASELGLSFSELKELLLQIQTPNQPMKERTFGKLSFFKSILNIDVLPDINRLIKYKQNKFVFPDILELHLGSWKGSAHR